MSDGPHRSLPMRKGWKKVAEYADNPSYETQQVADAMIQALERDVRLEVPGHVWKTLREVFGYSQRLLVPDLKAPEITELQRQSPGFPLRQLLIDCASQNLDEGRSGEEGLLCATRDALLEWALRGVRQVEEHYLRRSNSLRARDIRMRLEQSLGRASLDDGARCVLRTDSMPTSRPVVKSGLDDGVRLA